MDGQNGAGARLRKEFAVFDCDAHVNDPFEIWSDYVEPEHRELVRQAYWKDERQTLLHGIHPVIGGANYNFAPMYNPICIAGPQMNKKILRKLLTMLPLSAEQRAYLEHQGAYDPRARVREMDLMGIDQVMIIPTMLVMWYPFIDNADAARALARAYNNWAVDFCKVVPDRLHAAAWLPLQSPADCVEEIARTRKLGFRMGLVRPIDARGQYPNLITSATTGGPGPFDRIFRAFEEQEMVLGMHTFPAGRPPLRPDERPLMVSPGELIARAADTTGLPQGLNNQTLSFIFEASAWLVQVLLSGFLDRYPRLRMAILESNATWLPSTLEYCDRLFKLYARERRQPAKRLPSEAFYAQCFIAFEADETPVFRQWDRFEEVGIWSSDAYHHDGADAWSAMREMTAAGVPAPVQAKLLGENARRLYRLEPKLFVTEEPPPIARPDWFPQGPELEEWAAGETDPRGRGAARAAGAAAPRGGASGY
jgi:predicted TIM-barrel fold metal-dependent hydrolase